MLAFNKAACGAGRRVPRSRTRLSGRPPHRFTTPKSSPTPGEPLPPSMQPNVSIISRRADSTALAGRSAQPVRQTCRARGQAGSSVIILSQPDLGEPVHALCGTAEQLRLLVGGEI